MRWTGHCDCLFIFARVEPAMLVVLNATQDARWIYQCMRVSSKPGTNDDTICKSVPIMFCLVPKIKKEADDVF